MAYIDDQEKKALGRRETIFAKEQTAFGALAIPAATDTVLIKSFSATQDPEYHEDDQKRDTRDMLEGVTGILPHGDLSFGVYLKASGVAGTDPESADLLKAVMGSKVAMLADVVQATPAPTTTGCTVIDGTRFAVGQVRKIQMTTGTKLIKITDVSTNALTWEPALPSAPAAAANIYAGIWFKQATELPYMSIFRKMDDRVYSYQDCGIGKIGGKVDGKSILEAALSGGFTKFYMASNDEVGTGGIDGSSTHLPVKNANRFVVGAGCYFRVEDEIMKATLKESATQLTVDRGEMSTTPVPHVVDTPITPWYPTITESGYLMHGKFGMPWLKLGAAWEDVPTEEFNWDMDNAPEWQDGTKNDEGVSSGFDLTSARKITATLKMLYRWKYSKLYVLADEETTGSLIMPVGRDVGKTWVLCVHQVKIVRPKIEGDKTQVVELALKAHATSAYNNAFSIFAL